jgi:AraC-like DNA-binding protein
LGRPLARFLAAVPDACAESQGDSGVIEHSTVDLLRMALQLTAPSKTSARTSTLSLRAKQLVEDRLDDPDFDREELAAALGMSVRALSRLFSSARTSPSEYIRSRRLERCRYALLETKMASLTVTEVAFANGFNDSSHFSSAFRKAYGMSPRDYRADPAGLTRRGSRPQKV